MKVLSHGMCNYIYLFSKYVGIFISMIYYCICLVIINDIQSLKYETGQIGVFWDFLWRKNFVWMICETYLALECVPKSPWPTAFEKLKIHQPNLEKLQIKGSKIEAFLLNFPHFPQKQANKLQSCFLWFAIS